MTEERRAMGLSNGKVRCYAYRATVVLVTLALVGWGARSVYLRLTEDPPGYQAAASAAPARLGTDQPWFRLGTSAAYFTAPLTYTLPDPPAGQQWAGESYWSPSGTTGANQRQLVLDDVRYGDWTPESRPHLRAAIAFLDQDETRQTLQTIQAIAAEDWELPTRASAISYLSNMRAIVRAFASDARHQAETHHDPAAAWADLRAALDLNNRLATGGTLDQLVRDACVSLILDELRRTIPAASNDLLGEIDEYLLQMPSLRETWAHYIEAEGGALREFVDLSFTRRPDGNGWYVLTTRELARSKFNQWFGPGMTSPRRSRLWDLAGYLYNDRRTVEGKIARYLETLEGLPRQPYPAARQAFQASSSNGPLFNALDGYPMAEFDLEAQFKVYQQGAIVAAACDATRTVIALERYRRATGAYPETLAALVPTYLPALPDDPLGDGPLCYTRDAPETYTLWSWGRDGDNDGGAATVANRPRSQDGDERFDEPRSQAYFEPQFEPADTK